MKNNGIQDLMPSGQEYGLSRRQFVARTTALGISVGALGAVLQACGGSGSGSTSIELWHGWAGADNTQMLNTVIADFNKSQSDRMKVNATGMGWDQLFSKWVVAFASGRSPDVVMFHPSELPEYATRNMIIPIDDLVKDAGIDLSSVPAAAIEGVHWEGKLYGVPGDLHPLGMYFNTDMVQTAGLDRNNPPKTKDELLTWAEKLTIREGNKTKQYGIYMPSTGAYVRWFWYSLVHQYGGSFLNEDGTCAFDSQAAHDALQFIVDLFHKYKVVTPGSTGTGIDPVAAKQAAMWFIGPWEVNQRIQQKLNFATAPLPVVGTKPAAWGNAHCQVVCKQKKGEKSELDLAFMKWFFENYDRPATVVGIIPLNAKAREKEAFTTDKRYPYYKAFIDELDYVALEPALPQYTAIFSFGKPTPLSKNLEAAITGSISVDKALKEMKKGIDEQLKQKI